MFENQLNRAQSGGRDFRFGLGFRIEDRGRYNQDYGWGGAAGTRFWVNPEQEMVVLFMTQVRPSGDRFGDAVREAAYKAIVD
jgi:CubicO group peptidase (beta-lactamase class C family)